MPISKLREMELILVARNNLMKRAFGIYFPPDPKVQIITGDICSLTCDALVSPGNSKGDMGGGLDLAVRNRFGEKIEKKLQQKIKQEYAGVLPVGKALILPTGDRNIPWVISAPTMEKPEEISGTFNVFWAMLGVMKIIKCYQKINKVAFPALGTGVGKMEAGEAARQMWLAYVYFSEDFSDRRQKP